MRLKVISGSQSNRIMIVRFHPEADIELHKALQWYAQQKLGLDTEFVRCIDETIFRIKRNPNTLRLIMAYLPIVVASELVVRGVNKGEKLQKNRRG